MDTLSPSVPLRKSYIINIEAVCYTRCIIIGAQVQSRVGQTTLEACTRLVMRKG